jgi:hypothetical protein
MVIVEDLDPDAEARDPLEEHAFGVQSLGGHELLGGKFVESLAGDDDWEGLVLASFFLPSPSSFLPPPSSLLPPSLPLLSSLR